MSKFLRIAIVAAVVLIIVAVVILITGRHPADAPAALEPGAAAPGPAAGGKISQADHDAFIASAIPSCQKAAAQNPKITNTGVSNDGIEKYCRCVAEKSADIINQDELTYMVAQKTLPPSLQPKTQDIAAGCASENLKPAH